MKMECSHFRVHVVECIEFVFQQQNAGVGDALLHQRTRRIQPTLTHQTTTKH